MEARKVSRKLADLNVKDFFRTWFSMQFWLDSLKTDRMVGTVGKWNCSIFELNRPAGARVDANESLTIPILLKLTSQWMTMKKRCFWIRLGLLRESWRTKSSSWRVFTVFSTNSFIGIYWNLAGYCGTMTNGAVWRGWYKSSDSIFLKIDNMIIT